MRKAIILIIVLAVIAGGVFLFIRLRSGQRASALSNLQTVAVERGELVASIGATGTVRANQTAILPWQTTGSVSDVSVSVGEQVTADQVLAKLEATSLPQNVLLAGVDLVNARTALDDLLKPPTELSVKQAEQAIAKAEETVRDLEQHVNNLKTASTQSDIDQARASVTLAKDQLDKAREDYAPYENKPEDNLVRASLLGRLAQVQAEGLVRIGAPTVRRHVETVEEPAGAVRGSQGQRRVKELRAIAEIDHALVYIFAA